MRPYKYILIDKIPVVENDLIKWATWVETANNVIAGTMIGDVHVSTVFLCLDNQLYIDGEPLLFETMVFNGEHDRYQKKYSTYEAAERGHAVIVEMVKGSLN